MDKKPSPARLKKKGAYLPNNEQPGDETPPAVDQAPPAAEDVPSTLERVRCAVTPQVYQRARWKHVARWLAFLFILMLDLSVVGSTIQAQLTHHTATNLQLMAKMGILYFMILFCNLMVVPSIAMEAYKVEVSDKGLVCYNLLLKCTIAWEEIVSISAPIYLKFAIIRTKRFFQLINKRDIPDFNELMQTMRTCTGLTSK